MKRPYVLSIAGFDPSSGAGITSDIKTFEQHEVYGLSVISSITYQNESEFMGINWLSLEDISQQLLALASKYKPACIKIGLIQSAECLTDVISQIKKYWPEAFIIWDPILKASAGFSFHSNLASSIKVLVKDKINLITPNLPEYLELFGETNPQLIADELNCNILLKGGHTSNPSVCDELYQAQKRMVSIISEKVKGDLQKHGTGCVLSSAIAAQLANGEELKNACHNAHFYVKSFIASNESLLGYHTFKSNRHE